MIKLCSIKEYDDSFANLPVVLVGAGNNSRIILNEHTWNILGAVDNNNELSGKYVNSGSRETLVHRWEDLYNEEFSECALMITPLMASGLIDQVENDEILKDRMVFVYSYMQAIQWDIDRIAMSRAKFDITRSETSKIPKVIHYFWFSGDPYPEKVQRCIDSWRKYCPDYEFIKWDHENYKTDNVFCNEALSVKNWAFASDYGRCDVLRKYGGIYLDLDVELIKPLDDLLYDDGFFVF